MKVIAFNGSMRGPGSITNIMVEEFLAGAEEAGAEVEQVFLVKQKINHCRGCLTCWVKTPGRCVFKDDMTGILEKYIASDIVVMASPVYVENVTGVMKDFMDRLIPLTDPHFEPDENGETRHVKRYEDYPKIVAMSNSGFVENTAFDVLRILFKRISRSMNADLIAEIYRGGGAILGLDRPGLALVNNRYKSLLKKAGREVAEDRKISDETQSLLNNQDIPTEVYNLQVNALWDGLIAKAQKNRSTD